MLQYNLKFYQVDFIYKISWLYKQVITILN